MKALKRKLIPLVDFCFRLYWFIFRPHTFGAVAIIANARRDKVLLIKQSYGSGSWKLCGGSIHNGEDPRDTIVREIKEELGMSLHQPEYFYEFTSTRQYKQDHVHVFILRGEGAPIIDNVEVIEAAWFSVEDLPKRLSSIATEALDRFRTQM